MNEDRKRGILKSKILTLIVITSMLAGSGTVSAIETNSEGSFEVTEQMQSQTAHGTVVDPVGDPVIGASILEKGTSNGTITDIDGNFSLNVKSGATLVISYIGFRTQEIKAGANMSITLAEDYETQHGACATFFPCSRFKPRCSPRIARNSEARYCEAEYCQCDGSYAKSVTGFEHCSEQWFFGCRL